MADTGYQEAFDRLTAIFDTLSARDKQQFLALCDEERMKNWTLNVVSKALRAALAKDPAPDRIADDDDPFQFQAEGGAL